MSAEEKLTRKELTRNQIFVIETIRRRGCSLVAAVTEDNWTRGQRAYLDVRCPARRGIVRAFEQGNTEATEP